MRTTLALCLAALALSATPASAAVLYSEDFEDGIFDGATLGDDLPGGLGGGSSLFHVTQNAPASGSYTLGFTRDETPGNTPNGTYANDYTGTLYSPEVVLPSFGAMMLSFDVANFGRGDSYYDRFDIGIFTGGGHFVKASTYPDYANIGAEIYSQGAYNAMQFDISQYMGQAIRIYIHYSVIGQTPFDYPGGRIDNLLITDDSMAVPEPGAIGLLGLGLIGVATGRRRRKA
ncbi:PEP-CTERM sorting domain-containing protein [Sphingoaurantiacus capsulatus]|uniref:PEP-CTERM sorting domain-containing protein n=1 Tax=Sphingoaurantiacus capsulatus TaxID=1771310 RepID=A0ABV7XC46_9SPHN